MSKFNKRATFRGGGRRERGGQGERERGPHLDLHIADLALGQLDELELAQQGVLGGYSIVSSIHHHAHLALVTVHGREGLLGQAWGGHGVWDQLVQLVAHHGDTQ